MLFSKKKNEYLLTDFELRFFKFEMLFFLQTEHLLMQKQIYDLKGRFFFKVEFRRFRLLLCSKAR